ncbi:hypothetical protein BS47DRAFT_1363028 [Hydnum rufescens UP504]|uniref:Uncharacterized protein n=1 Tax=Hydnum rufescens UP504 TaxID=1448309 RepID=A0A9P6DSX5_9AGAM|nr:hypothetical protein BS47DRAFT_1363028 [Hydnum rufescens UP504]
MGAWHSCPTDTFSLCETPAKLCADKAQGEIQGCVQPPRALTLTYPQPLATTKQVWCHTPAEAGSFSLHETSAKLCTGKAQGKIWGCTQPPRTLTFMYPQPLE